MNAHAAYLLVGAIAAITASRDIGLLGMFLLLVAWPFFALAALAVLGIRATGNFRREDR